MAPRSVWSSVVGFGVLAATMQIARGPAVPKSAADGVVSVSRSSTSGAGSTQAAAAVPSWSDAMKRDPKGAGRKAALEDFEAKLCGFVVCPGPAVEVKTKGREPKPPAGKTRHGRATEDGAKPARSDALSAGTPDVVIAIAPDPVHTHLALLFDRYIDGLQDALQDSGWNYQGHWMPWPVTDKESDGGNIEAREEERLFREGWEQLPGVILFRPAGNGALSPAANAGHPLVVLVVGDSPTTGVVRSQFEEALRQFARLSGKEASLRILGPSFTGSGPSLRSLLDNAKAAGGVLADKREVWVASGSVSDGDCAHFLPPGISKEGDSSCGGRFVSFAADALWQTQQTWAFLREHAGLEAYQVAQLTEDESGFGALLSGPPAGRQGGKAAGEVLSLKFPRNISHLRSAYQKNSIWGFGGSSGGANSVSLNLDFEEPHHAVDSVPSYAQGQMPVSQEGSMGQVASILEEHRIRAVLVSATDVLDELFVAQILARQAPNVMVILRGTDVLYLRSGDRDVYRNMYTVGPWPLIPSNVAWTAPPAHASPFRAFASGDAQGVYTATRYLVDGGKNALQDYRSPLREDLRSDAPQANRPPIWFSAIGHGALWPMGLLNDPAVPVHAGDKVIMESATNLPPIAQLQGPEAASGEQAATSQRMVLLLVSLLCLLHAGKSLHWKVMEQMLPRYNLYDPATRRPKLALLVAMTVLAMLVLCLAYEPPAMGGAGESFWFGLFRVMLLLLALAAARLCFLLAGEPAAVAARVYGPVGLTSAGKVGVLLLAVVFAVCAFYAWHGIWRLLPWSVPAADGMAQFFAFRARHPFSGASPVLPVLIALSGVTCSLGSHLGRLVFSPALKPRLPERVPEMSHCPTAGTMEQVCCLLEWPSEVNGFVAKLRTLGSKLSLFVAVVFCSVLFVVFLRMQPIMLESRGMHLAVPVLFFLLLVSMLWDLAMAALIWNRLKVLCLVPLELSPLRRGFNSISGMTWRSLWMPHGSYAQYKALTRALEQGLRDLMGLWADQEQGGMSLRQASRNLWTAVGNRTPGISFRPFGEVQKRTAKMAEWVLFELHGSWAREMGLITLLDHARGDGDKAVEKGEAESVEGRVRLIAEEWVALTYVHAFRQVLVQVRMRLFAAAMVYILLVWSVTCYPFLNRHTLMIGLSVLLGLLGTVIISTYASINRDPILSRTTDETPGKLDMDFYFKTASMVGIPLLGFVASQFPEVSSFLFSWIEPGMAAGR